MSSGTLPFYIENLSQETNSYELKMFRVQHEETQLTTYLKKLAKKHSDEKLNKIYLIRFSKTGQVAAWFGLKAATLPYNDKNDAFLIPAIELTHFAVDERFKSFEYAAPEYDEGCRFLYFPIV